jgi:hypothetical protein
MPTDPTSPSPPLIYVGDDSKIVQAAISDKLTADGMLVYTPGSANDPNSDTKFLGGFKCALLHLERVDGKADAVDAAELLRVYQPDLPVAFMHESPRSMLVQRAGALGPIFRIPGDLEGALAWVRSHVTKAAAL